MKQIKFSITIPAYKKKYLAEAIESCLSQTYPCFEVIIVDDASPEDLKSVVKDYEDCRLRYFRNEHNCGAVDVVDNWNICLSYCTGDYVICMGDDDKLTPECLQRYTELIQKYPNLDAYHGHAQIIDENSEVFEEQIPRPKYESVYSLIYHRWTDRHRQFIGDFCYRVETLRKVGGYYKLPLAWASDDITAVQMTGTKGVANTQLPCFQYRVNRYTISRSSNGYLKLESIFQEKEWYEKFLEHSLHTDTDCEQNVKAIFKEHFHHKSSQYAWEAVEQNPSKIYLCFFNHKKYELSILWLIRVFCSVMCIKLKTQ